MGAMGVYQLFEHGGTAVGGMCNTQGPSTPPSWLSYVHVADSSRAVAAVKAAGGRLLHGPVEVPGGSWIALFMDPQGGAFAVHEMPRTVRTAGEARRLRRRARGPSPARRGRGRQDRRRRKSRSPKKVVREEGGREEGDAPQGGTKKTVRKARRSYAAPGRPRRAKRGCAGWPAKKKTARRSTRRPARKRTVRRRRR